MDELVRAVLEKQGIRGEPAINRQVEEAERASEERIKVTEAENLLRQLMRQKQDMSGPGRLMQRGYKRWKSAFYMGTKEVSNV